MGKPFETTLLKPGAPVVIRPDTIEMRPVRMFILPEGDIKNCPSLSLSLIDHYGHEVVGQLSFRMLFESLDKASRTLFEYEWKLLKEEYATNETF